MNTVIGISGPKRSGKTTIQKILKEKLELKGLSVATHTFSDPIVEACRSFRKPPTRDNCVGVVEKLRELWGPSVLADAIKERILESREDVIVLAGLRWLKSDLAVLRSFLRSVLVYVDADDWVRYERAKKDSEKPDESTMTFEEFLKRDKASTEIEVPQFKNYADFTIDNSDDSTTRLEQEIDYILFRIHLV